MCSPSTIGGGDSQYIGFLVTTENDPNYNPPVQVTDADGTVYYFSNPERYTYVTPQSVLDGSLPDYIEDRNGNKITITPGTANGSFTIADTVGRAAITSTGMGSSGSTNTITTAGMSYNVTWTTTHPNYTTPYVVVYDVQGDYYCSQAPDVTTTETVVSSITLPNTQQYKFYYGDNNPNGFANPYGLLSEVDYPTGAWVRYTWKMSDTYSEALTSDAEGLCYAQCIPNVQTGCQSEIKTPVVATRTVGLSGSSNPMLTQTFSYSTTWNTYNGGTGATWSQKQTKVTTLDNVRNLTSLTTYTYASYDLPQPSNNPYIPDFVAAQIPVEASVQYYNWGNTSSPIRTVNKTWFDPYDIESEQTVLQDVSPSQTSQVTYCYVQEDQNYPCVPSDLAQLAEKDEYDFGASSPSRKTVSTYASFPKTPIGGLIADKPCSTVTSDGSGNRYAEVDYFYDNGATGTVCGTPGTPSVISVSNLPTGTHDESNYSASSTVPRGNLTQKTQWASTGTSPVTTYTYDETGQVLSKTDPCGNSTCSDMSGTAHTTTFGYSNSYTVLSSGANSPYSPSANTDAYLTSVVNALGQTEKFTYDYNNGQLTDSQDQNDITAGRVGTTYLYNDPFARPKQVNYPDGGQTTLSYVDSSTPSITSTKLLTSTVSIINITTADSLGRTTTTELSSDPDGATYTATTYDGENKTYTQSNPYRTTGDPTYGITTYTYDALGRTTQVAKPDGSKVSTAYSGNQTTVTDEAGKQRKSQSDGLGRLTYVWEAPNTQNFETIYAYDPLNDLLSVTQEGGSSSSNWRLRSFLYDSLSRLTSATNPESGTIAYAYDANSNLNTKTAPSPNQPSTGTATVTTTYSYDALNRLTGKRYNDSDTNNPQTASVSYGYDEVALSCATPIGFSGASATNGIGRRTAMCYNAGSKSWQYDPMGRIQAENDRFIWLVPPYSPDEIALNGVPTLSENTEYYYYLNGDLQNVYYPGPKGPPNIEFYTSESAAGRIITAGDSENNVLGGATYSPDGQLATGLIGRGTYAGSTISNTYNNRLQPVLISASTASGAAILNLTYNFNLGNGTTGTDNGNVIQIANGKNSNRTQNFVYDPLNRIWQAYSSGPNWGETYSPNTYAAGTAYSAASAGIDAWGNLTNRSGVTGKTSYEPLSCPANTSNQLNTCFTYDAAGNLIKNGTTTYTYDAENRLIATEGYSYVYDGDGQRVEKCTEGTTAGTCASNATGLLYWLHAVSGGTLVESDLGGNWTAAYGLIHGQIFDRVDIAADAEVDVRYYFHDHLHSTNVVTDCCGNILEEYDYFPYGA